MSGVSTPPQRMTWVWKPRKQAGAVCCGAIAGLLCGTLGIAATLALSGQSIREVPLTTYLIVFPALGAIAGDAYWRRWRADCVPEDEALRRAWRRRRLALGFGTGCAAAVVATGVDFLWRGWLVLGGPALLNLLLFPYLCSLVAFNLTRTPGEGVSFRNARVSIGGLMVLIAYLAVLFGVGVEGQRIGGAAQRYHAQRIGAKSQAVYFRALGAASAADAPRRRDNAAQLRAGTIPEGILESQKVFLNSLSTATPEYRAYRYGIIADGEDLQRRTAESNAASMQKLATYYEGLAHKYARAERQPWKPLMPDPPPP